MVHTWAKDYVKYDGHNGESIHIFLSGSEGTGKPHLVKVIYSAISKTSGFLKNKGFFYLDLQEYQR